jgi:hypothetical protein
MSSHETIGKDHIEQALLKLKWEWLCDKQGWYRIGVASAPEFGDLETEYWLGLAPELSNTLVLRLYGTPQFAGIPRELVGACADWNVGTPAPKAALIPDDDGDSRLVLEWAVPCWEESVSKDLVFRWVDHFRRGCAAFLARNAAALAQAPRFVEEDQPTLH